MTTGQELQASFDLMAAIALTVKADRDSLLIACKKAWQQLDERYDVSEDQEGNTREYPFEGAGELMGILKTAIEKAERA